MIYINEMELFEFGQLCGVVGTLKPGAEKRLADALQRIGCTCVLFCYRGEQDDRLVSFMRTYAEGNIAMRFVYINNEQETSKLPLSMQKKIESIYVWVDMVLRSTWSVVDLPICVAVHSDAMICLAGDDGESILTKILPLRCSRVHKLLQ